MSDFDLSGLFQQARRMQEDLAAAQESAATTVVEGVAGGGLVRIELTGGLEARAVHIDPSVIDPDDADLLSDLVLAALRDALARVGELQDEGGLDLGGLDLGGLVGGLGLGGSGGFDLGALGGLLGGAAADPEAPPATEG